MSLYELFCNLFKLADVNEEVLLDETRSIFAASDHDIPNEAANSGINCTEMQSVEGPQNVENVRKRWEMNYHEAAIFLEVSIF